MQNRSYPRSHSLLRILRQASAAAAIGLAAVHAGAQEEHHHHDGMAMNMGAAASDPAVKPVFVASTAKSFAALMDDAMAVMDDGMKRAPMNGQSDHDFITMMMPHHQGAVDMAKAVLLYTDDPEIRNLALGIVAEQQNEIRVMQAWLKRHP